MANPNNCQHKNIVWEDFFKEGKVKDDGEVNQAFKSHDAYCLDCGETKNERFAKALQRWYCKEIRDWLLTNKLYNFEFEDFLKKDGFDQFWDKLKTGKVDEEYFDALGGQMIFKEVAMWIEDYCRKFKKEKQNNPNTPQPRKRKKNNQQRERERERANSAWY